MGAVRTWPQDAGDATTLRRRILVAFERAEREPIRSGARR